ncbi:unnamed protein product [Caenorhabditis bovis]|uniref:Uncharacterized protein n=1 Tax=Caenorhabditis bovis TaxID=2654633 RepID=A0A8S1EPZ1_9PELO|nr:unnamed protein product [Caenorhabditis bovis]
MSACYRRSLIPAIVVLICLMAYTATAQRQQQHVSIGEQMPPLTAYKRFYSWEDAKRAASLESEEMRTKRKQFYAWAGKRSVHSQQPDELDHVMDKRKQFYAWAGK